MNPLRRLTIWAAPRVLAPLLARAIAPLVIGPRALSIGSGSGIVERAIARRAGVRVEGYEPHPRPTPAAVPTHHRWEDVAADGPRDTVMLVDVLHHVPDRTARDDLMARAFSVASRRLIVKDHHAERDRDRRLLLWQDRMGNGEVVMRPGTLYPSVGQWIYEQTRWRPKGWRISHISLGRPGPLDIIIVWERDE